MRPRVTPRASSMVPQCPRVVSATMLQFPSKLAAIAGRAAQMRAATIDSTTTHIHLPILSLPARRLVASRSSGGLATAIGRPGTAACLLATDKASRWGARSRMPILLRAYPAQLSLDCVGRGIGIEDHGTASRSGASGQILNTGYARHPTSKRRQAWFPAGDMRLVIWPRSGPLASLSARRPESRDRHLDSHAVRDAGKGVQTRAGSQQKSRTAPVSERPA